MTDQHPRKMPSVLLDTHPRIGKAAWVAYWESDLTGEWPGQRFCEVLRHDHERAVCRHCGDVEHRHTVTDRLLVGCNKGDVRTTWLTKCNRCGNGYMSNYRQVWAA